MAAELEALERSVAAWFRARASRYGLVAADVRARYVLNLGGFGHPSFKVGDGARAFHLKLDADLAIWRRVAPELEARYRAPRLVDWVEMDGHAGALFEHIDGQHADFLRDPALLGACVELLGRLHADVELAEALPDGGSLADHFSDWFLGCCRADLDENPEIEGLVGTATATWMRAEIEVLEARVRGSAAFAAPARAPVHSDLWAHNVLVTPDGEWFIIDWDDLRRGDPVVDLAILLWGVPGGERFAAGLGAEERERFALCQRALLLSDAIDSLADYFEAARAPEHMEAVRAAKWQVHAWALREYRARY